MTSRELLACLKDRPCTVCKFKKENGCCKWTCVFEEEPTDSEIMALNYQEGYIEGFRQARETFKQE